MKSGATESSFYYLAQHYKFPDNVDVKRTTHEIIQSNKQYKVIWAHDNCDQIAHIDLPNNIDKVDLIVCVSEWERQQYIKYKRAPAEKLVVIPNGVADMFRYSSKIKSKTCIFFSAPHKGIVPLPKIWKQVIKNHPDAHLKVFSSMSLYENAGADVPEKPEFIEAIEELKKLPNVLYSPCIEREELISHIEDAAFFIHPNVWEETFCVSMAEAMACGCYPIVTDLGALPETSFGRGKYIPMTGKNTPTGWDPSPRFINEFAQELTKALGFFDKEPHTFYAATKDLSDFTVQTYSWARIAGIWEETINRLVSSNTKDQKMVKMNISEDDYLEWRMELNELPMPHIDYLYRLKYEYGINPKVIYDIGSNLLHWSKVAGSVWKNSEIYHIDGYSKLEQLYKKRNLTYAIEVLGSKNNKEVIFYQNIVNSGGCSCYEINYEKYPSELQYFKNQYYSEEIKKIKTLDTLVQERNWKFPDLIKMDVQGSELDIMMGASKVIQNCHHIILELQSQEFNKNAPMQEEVIRKMNEWGYDIKDKLCVNPLEVDSDYYFVKRV